MNGPPDYDDGLVRLDGRGVTLRRYYFPWAGAKVVPYDRIKAVQVRPLTWLAGKWRLWGSGDFRHWFGLDLHRRGRGTVIALDLGRHIRPSCTPGDADRVVAILRERVSGPIDS